MPFQKCYVITVAKPRQTSASAIFPSILAYLCFTRGVELIGGIRAGIFVHLIPLLGAFLAVGLLDEPLGGFHLAGSALMLTGVSVASGKSWR
jgi:drug/metabolite transporter (DMT)-like permease